MKSNPIPIARFVTEIMDRDPISNEKFSLYTYQDEKTGRYFSIDSSFIIDEEPHLVRCPFGHVVELADETE
jgi:hypothetical protein